MRVITYPLEVFVFVLVDRIWPTLDDYLRQRIRRARDLLAHLFEMILVNVDVAAGPDEHTRFEITLLRENQPKPGIAGNVEWHTEKHAEGAQVVTIGRTPFWEGGLGSGNITVGAVL